MAAKQLAVNARRWRALGSLVEPQSKGPVVYWCSRDQRAHDNWALLHACEIARSSRQPVAVAFSLVSEYLGAGARQFGFMLRGLRELESTLSQRGIRFYFLFGSPDSTVPALAQRLGASLLVCDFSPLRLGRQWRRSVTSSVKIPVHEVDAHNITPAWVASEKQETAARTIRKKIHAGMDDFLTEFPDLPDMSTCGDWGETPEPEPPSSPDWDVVIDNALERGKDVAEVPWIISGETAAHAMLHKSFISKRIGKYGKRNDPTEPGGISGLSPYFHFGQLASQRAVLELKRNKSKAKDAVETFIEEAVVRKELSDNFVLYNNNYDNLDGAANWAKETHEKHRNDERDKVYSFEQLEKGDTYDDLWNACQLEMVHLGKMHGFLRMYWAKKILEWSATPEDALQNAITLNDRYEIDGRDPNGYVGCMWAIVGVHDQGFQERSVFGKVRYMNYQGCKRKFDVQKYVTRIHKEIKEVKAGKTPASAKDIFGPAPSASVAGKRSSSDAAAGGQESDAAKASKREE
jgi:deoxyribodipyrimidine photo-lyase